MKAVQITYNRLNENVSLLQMVKDVKFEFGIGLKEAKDYIDNIREEATRPNKAPIILGEGSEKHRILMYMDKMGYLTLNVGDKVKVVNVKSLPKRQVAKMDKEHAKALAWATSLHPKKIAMINLLIKDGYGI